MGLVGSKATFVRNARRSLHHLLALVLTVSTLSAISIISPPAAKALVDADCTPTVSGLTVSAVASGNDCILTFTAGTGTWTTPAGISTISIVVVGGGGGGGDSMSTGTARTGGGGGAGGYFYSSNVPVTGSIQVSVGAGGTGAASSTTNGTAGGDSAFGTLKVGGGGYGNSWEFATSQAAGAGRGGSDYVSGGSGGGGRSRGAGNNNAKLGGAAGTIAGSVVFQGSSFTGTAGVAGLNACECDLGSGAFGGAITSTSRTSSISGSSVVYSKAGIFRPWNSAANTAAPQTYGSGGSANYNYGTAETAGNTAGGAGAQGVVFIRYAMTASTITTPTTGLSGTVGSAYSLTLVSGGGSGSGTYSVTGTLPAGITLDTSTGVISGTPTLNGTFPITATFLDSNSTSATTSSFSLVIAAAAALTPAFGSTTSTTSGFNVQISNYSSDYTWAGTATASGSVAINGTGLVTVTGVAPGTSSTATITTTRTGYTGGSATVSATSITGSALTPAFGSTTATATGFTVQISNYSASYTWAGTATASGSVAINGTGLVTVTGVSPGTSSTATITTTRTGYTGGSATVSATSITGSALTPAFGSTTATADGFTVQISNYSASYTWGGSATASGSVAISDSGLVTVTGVAPGTSSTVTITTTRTGYTGGSATVSATSISSNVATLSALTLTTATLSALTLTTATLSPTFATNTTTYTASVTNATTSITVTPTRTQANATITVNGTAVTSGSASGSISLNVGSNTITVIGTAQDGSTTSTYTVTVTRAVGAATKVAVTRASVGTQRGTAFTTQPQITVQDSGSNTVTSSSAVVTATVSSGGTLVGTNTATASSGVATFTGLGVNGNIGTTYTITYTVSGLTVATATVTLTGTTCDGSFTCQKGDTGPGGGTIFYVAPSFFTQVGATGSMCTTNCKYLEAAPGTWYQVSGGDPTRAWAKTEYQNQSVPNYGDATTALNIGYGYRNTQLIIAQGNTDVSTSAAALAQSYRGGSQTDWFLPTFYEMHQLCTWQTAGTCRDNPNSPNTGPGASGFISGEYWMSAEATATNAYRENMAQGGGQGYNNPKSQSKAVRPIRAFGPAPIVISTAAIAGVAEPVAGATPVTTTTAGTGYTGTVSWSGSPTTFAPGTTYTATITLTAAAGYTVTGVTENFFTVSGSTTRTNPANSGVVTAVFPATVSSNVATLSALVLSSGTLSPDFASGTTTYTASVANTVAIGFTVTPTTTQANATTVQYLGAVGTTAFTGALSVGANVIRTVVTAQDGTTTSTYTVTVTRAAEILTVTFNANDGSGTPATSTQSITSGTATALTASSFSRTGYTFAGWDAAADGSGTDYTNQQSVTITAGMTLFAMWTANSNTLAYNGNTSDGGTTPTGGGSKNYASTITVAANTFTKTGYTFAGWNTAANGTGTSYAGTGLVTFTMPDAAVTLYAQWTGNSNSFVFDANTGSGTMTTQSIISGASTAITTNTFTKTGYAFSGWNTAANGSGAPYSDGQSITITAGATLYAQWSANSNSFVFDANTGSGTMTSQTINSGTATALTANTFTKTGYTFAGWNTAANNSGTGYSNSESITITAGATLFAQWTINTNTFAYNGNTSDGGSAPAGGGTKNYAATITVAANSYTKTGYTFDSWNTAADGTGTSYAATGSVTFAMPDAAVTLYAQWIANTNTLAYNGNTSTSGSAPTGGGSKSFGTTITVAANSYTKTGYSFIGWNTAANGSGTSYAGTGSVTFVMPDASVTLYAQWSANTLVITFNSQGGSNVTAGSTVTAGSVLVAPTPPTKANYTFAGWATSIGGTAITFEFIHGQTADFTLYALWTANQYSLTYTYNSATSGNTTTSDSFTTGGTAITLPTPLRTGYTFAGWFADSLFTTSIGLAGASYSPTGSSLTLSAFAKWTANPYNVTYSAATTTSGVVPTDATDYIYATNVIIKGNTGSLVRTGYTFLGWTSASDGSSTLLTSGSTFSTPAANMTFYAKWSANTYTITYNKNGATGSPTNAMDSYTTGGTAVSLTSVGTMAKTGFDFSGWSTTPTGSVISVGYTTTSNVTLYAIWSIKNISITFSKGSAINESFFNFPTNRSASYGTLITLSDTVDSSIDIGGVSHAFMGWNDGTSVYQSGATYLLGETAPTFTAVWVKIYAVRYAFNGGTAAAGTSALDGECQQSDSTCLNGQVITSNAAPTKTGYDFAGWVDQNSQSVPTAASFTVSSSRYLIYANWTAINYAITYNANGGATTPASFTKQISQSFTVANAITRTGYTFSGWSDGTSVFGAGAIYYVSSSPVSLTAQWTPNIYTVIYDWNGGSGSTTANTSYTVGTNAITLPVVGDHVKDGYNFAGWSTSSDGSLISGGYTPTADATLYAIWGTGSYTVTYDYNWGSVSNTSASVLNGTSLILPTPTRLSYVFDGWYTARTSGSKVGNAGTSHQPTGSKTLYARWIQSSLYGIDPANLLRLGQTTARNAAQATFGAENETSKVSVTVPAGSLPDGTVINFDLVGDFSRARSLLSAESNYIISMVVSWLAPDETVPNTNAGKAISLTIENDSIKAGASIYAIVAGEATLLTTATQNGIVTVSITSDPEVVVIATKPSAPTSVTASSNGTRQSVVSWTAPSTDGGSTITGYTVTANTGQTCTSTTLTTCTVAGLTNGVTYAFTVTATNNVGTSISSASASATTANISGAPTSVTASSAAAKQSVISWTAPTSNGGSTITGYTVTSNTGATCTTATTTCTVTGLNDGTTYTFTVTATNLIGVSTASISASARTADAVIIAPPISNVFAGQSSSPAPAPAPAPTPEPTPVVVVGSSEVKIPTIEVKPTEPVVIAPQPGPSVEVKPTEPVVITPQPGPSVEVKPTEPVVVAPQPGPSVEVKPTEPVVVIKPTTVKVDSASQKFIADVKIVDGKVVLTPEVGFSGKRIVKVTINENGVERSVQISLTVLPEMVTKPVVTPTGITKSTIKWTVSPNATSYTVYLDGKKVCSTSGSSCTINKMVGPKAEVEILSNGGDKTVSEFADAQVKLTSPVVVGQLVSTTNSKTKLSAVDISTLSKISAMIKSQGFKTVVISEITANKSTAASAATRLNLIKKYLIDKSGVSGLKIETVRAATNTNRNIISIKG